MGRPKGSRNKKGRIEYPRKCEHCDYVSNNPTMHHYHAKTHEKIPEGKLCDHGCGSSAYFKGTGGVYSCNQNSHRCPAYLERHSKKVKNDWKGADHRREQTRRRFKEIVHSEEIRKKTLDAVKSRAIISAEDAKDYRSYARKCRKLAQKWAKDNGYEIGQQTYHVDHRLSLVDAYTAKLDVDIASHPINLQVITAKENTRKWANSEISVNQLLEEIEQATESQ